MEHSGSELEGLGHGLAGEPAKACFSGASCPSPYLTLGRDSGNAPSSSSSANPLSGVVCAGD